MVYIPETGRGTLCVSSQAGCVLDCAFCSTGKQGFNRNLSTGEIIGQLWLASRMVDARISNVVMMGMGEPMLNLDAVLVAARRLPDIGITHRRTTVSTVGWLPGLRRFVDEVDEPIRLALSLHAPDGALRSELMPVNDRYPLEDVVAECRRYVSLRGRRVFVEYVMLAGVNDTVGQARSLARLLGPEEFKVNLIPYNPTGRFDGSTRAAIAAFREALVTGGVPATVRLTRGRDIAAACGQLAAERA
jgi:23S rRNA (adenine2503-C2)-methyltransferase